jgi:DHHC palmitoyltransferase
MMVCCHWARPKRLGKSYVWLESPTGELKVTMGPHWPGVLVVIAMIVGGTYVSFNIIGNIEVSRFWIINSAKVSSVFFFGATLAALLMTACTDPGIVRMTPILNEEEKEEEMNTTYCEVCSVHQPENMGIRHCYECDVCIMGHDHHCPWMGKCIGKKNMR